MAKLAAALLLALLAGCATSPGAAAPAPARPSTAAARPGDRAKLAAEKPEQICGKEAPLGSHLEVRRCRTVEAIEERRDQDQRMMLRPHSGGTAGVSKLAN